MGQKLVRAHPRGNGGAWRTRDTCEWFFSGGRCRAASRSGPARAREHGMSLGGWDGASQCALGRRRRTGWRPTQKASINVARYARLTKGSHVQHVARVANRPDAAGQQPAVGVAKALLPHRRRWCASRFSRGRAGVLGECRVSVARECWPSSFFLCRAPPRLSHHIQAWHPSKTPL